ncbi:diguanylate cyclase domain-containing protein [Actinoplanes xinjiangensis]|uniref:diguanylate cyclase domain-containing protein n=1 Tax=Actinoplanes xinjiangensis TaxID=512350 RepID=UPI0034404BFD
MLTLNQARRWNMEDRRGRWREAATHAFEPLLALPVVLALYPFGLVGHAPWLLTMAPFVLFGILEQPAVLDRLRRGRPGRWPSLGVVLHLLVVGWIIYVLGWGTVLPLGFALVATQHIRVSGARMWRPAAAWTAFCIVTAQIGIALGWVFSYLPPVPAQIAGLLGLMLTVFFIRVLGKSAEGRELAEAEARRSAAHFRELVQDSTDVVAVLGVDGQVTYLSPAILNVTGYPPEVYEATDYREHIHDDDAAGVAEALRDVMARPGGQTDAHLRIRHADGEWRWLEATMRNLTGNPAVEGIVMTSRDVTARRALQEQLAYDAHHDQLTGLINRAAFLGGMSTSLVRREGELGAAVLFIDLDGFKQINDTYGHRYGDALLVAVSSLLRRCVPSTALVGRLGGDEFAVLLCSVASAGQAVAVANRILEEMDTPVIVENKLLTARASIGIAVTGPGSADVAELLHHADLAMYTAKHSSDQHVQVYEADAMSGKAVMPRSN